MNEQLFSRAGIYYLKVITASQHYYYIGQTRRSFAQRWREHLRDLRSGQHANAQLQRLYRDGAVIVVGVIVVLKTNMTKQRIEAVEQRVITQAEKRGLKVINVVKEGEKEE